jgi:hypothetical protein
VFTDKDPIIVKFGKDVANMIHMFVWRIYMTDVITDYHSTVSEINGSVIVNDIKYINWRSSNLCSRGIYRLEAPYVRIGDLPENYFQIKELY